jgi:hypothetical protein
MKYYTNIQMRTLQAPFAPAQPPLGQPFEPSSQFRKGFAYFQYFQRVLPMSNNKMVVL